MNTYRFIPARRQRLAHKRAALESTALYGAVMVTLGGGIYWLAARVKASLPAALFFVSVAALLAVIFGGAWLVARTGGAE